MYQVFHNVKVERFGCFPSRQGLRNAIKLRRVQFFSGTVRCQILVENERKRDIVPYATFARCSTYLWLNLVNILRLLLLLKWGVWGVLKTKDFVDNVIIKGRVNFRT